MATAIPGAGYLPIHAFHTHPFTSTMHDHKGQTASTFNAWIVIATALIFFCVLTLYNVVTVAYNAAIGTPPTNGQSWQHQLASIIGLFLLWIVIVLIFYIIASKRGYLSGDVGAEFHDLSRVMARDMV